MSDTLPSIRRPSLTSITPPSLVSSSTTTSSSLSPSASFSSSFSYSSTSTSNSHLLNSLSNSAPRLRASSTIIDPAQLKVAWSNEPNPSPPKGRLHAQRSHSISGSNVLPPPNPSPSTSTYSKTITIGSRRGSIPKDLEALISAQRKLATEQKQIHQKQQHTLSLINSPSSSSSSTPTSSIPTSVSSSLESQRVVYLPRGGFYVTTKAGPLQFGMPPETIKDCMKLGLPLPTQYVLPKKRFDLQMGLNVAEFEFPAYYSFFIKRKRITLLTTEDVEPLIRSIFQETLLGPTTENIKQDHPEEFSPDCPRDAYPDLEKELSFFRVNPFDRTRLEVDTLLSFIHFKPSSTSISSPSTTRMSSLTNARPSLISHPHLLTSLSANNSPSQSARIVVRIAQLGNGVEVHDIGDNFVVYQDGEEWCRVPSEVLLSPPAGFSSSLSPMSTHPSSSSSSSNSLSASISAASSSSSSVSPVPVTHFVPPYFGVTMLGNSDGFDKEGTTTGFVLWMNRRGLMVDPPPHSGYLLRKHGISPRLIRGIILTHCHADHDAGTFQKILEEGKVCVYTTPTILNSFLRKYECISGLKKDFLQRLFIFRPVVIGERVCVHGGHLAFHYSLHSIPCVGFTAYCNGKSLIYSADTFNDPVGIQKLFEQGLMTQQRRDFLLHFPWDKHDLILHEAGVPPIHTPLSTFMPLPEHIKSKIRIVHKPPSQLPSDSGLLPAYVGPDNTIVLSTPEEAAASSFTLQVLDILSSLDIFSSLSFSKASELMQIASFRSYKVNEKLISEGEEGDEMFVICMGVVSVSVAKESKIIKHLHCSDYFGEMSLVDSSANGHKQLRTATIRAVTDVECLVFSRNDFLHVVRHTNVIERLRHLSVIQKTKSWSVLSSNSFLSQLTSTQKTHLLSILHVMEFDDDDSVWQRGEEMSQAVIVAEGRFRFENVSASFSVGAFLCDFPALLSAGPSSFSLCCEERGSLLKIEREDLIRFLEEYPGIKLALLDSFFLE